jgi:dihydroxyacetone kinase-like predicted kinase
MQKYCLEFVLHVHQHSAQTIKNSLREFGEGLEIADCKDLKDGTKNFKININTDEPTVIFDICAQFGRIKSIKINEEGRI